MDRVVRGTLKNHDGCGKRRKTSEQMTGTPEAYLQGRKTAVLHLWSNLRGLHQEKERVFIPPFM